MAIYLVDGKPRHGKTAWLISHVPAWLKEAQEYGLRLYSNVWIDVKRLKYDEHKIIGDIYDAEDRANPEKLLFYWRNMDAWAYMSRGTIICDEMTRYFNARMWASLSPETEIKLQQHGKEDLDIWGTTQHYSRVDVTLRVLIERFFRVERIFGAGNTTIISKVSEHYLEELQKWEANPEQFDEAKDVWSEYFFIRRKWKKLYDTKQQILASRPLPLRHEERFCPVPNCERHTKPMVSHA